MANDISLSDAANALRQRFLRDVEAMRPSLHRYCTRMTGSPLDGEDVVQETMIKAFYNLHTLRDEAKLRSWLFRVAHRCCLDQLRRRDGVSEWEESLDDTSIQPIERLDVSPALEAMISTLPPKERAAVLLKDVLDHSLKEVADIIDSTPNGVKAALRRGRQKLSLTPVEAPSRHMSPDELALVRTYLLHFNARDWTQVRLLARADARLELVGEAELDLESANYYENYARLPWRWKLELCLVDGHPQIVHKKEVDGAWLPHSFLKLSLLDGQVAVVRDYVHVHYLTDCCTTFEPM